MNAAVAAAVNEIAQQPQPSAAAAGFLRQKHKLLINASGSSPSPARPSR